MRRAGWVGALLAWWLAPGAVLAQTIPRPLQLERLNRQLCGRVIDHTDNHGPDRRIWSPALGERRDLYVYLPPGYDPCQRYPLMLVLHGFVQDEKLLTDSVVRPLDRAIASGRLPPMIVAVPDGSQRGDTGPLTPGTFFLDSELGHFEKYLVDDVWDFVTRTYPVRPEREAHVLFGVSMGGHAAFNKAIKYPQLFGVVVGVFPPLNLRWEDCHGRYMGNFDPCCWGWRTDFSRGRQVVGRFFGVYTVRLRQVIFPLYGRGNRDTLHYIRRENPVEMLDAYDVRPGLLEMYVAYAGKDEFNLDAQAESFLYVAKQKGLEVGVGYVPNGRHNEATALKLFPGIVEWLRPRLEPYAPR